MSANLDLVRSISAPWGRGDFTSVEWADPEIEYVIADGPDPGTWRGIAEMRAAWRDYLSNWQDLRAEPEEYRELDDQRVLLIIRQHGRGKRSGLGGLQTRGALLFHVQEGRVTRLVNYLARDRALADLGLDPAGG